MAKKDNDALRSARGRKRMISVLILAAVVGTISAAMFYANMMRGSTGSVKDRIVIVEAEGKVLYVVPLSDDIVLEVDTGSGSNRVKVADGEVSVTEADCKNQICVNTKAISRPGQTIVCLPHRVVISIADKRGYEKNLNI